MATYRDLITGTLRLLGIKAQGQTATGAEAVDALAVLNEMIDQWNASDALLYTTTTVVHPLSPPQQSYTIGPSGDIALSVRPTRLNGAWLRNGVNTPNTDTRMTILSDVEYGNIISKTVTTTIPYYIYLDREWPLANLYLWPVPTSTSYSLVLQFLASLNSGVGLDDTESLPPAYRQALRYNLAVLLAPEYGLEPSPTVVNTAITSKMLIQQSNFQGYRMDFDEAANGLYSITSDSFRNY